MVGLPENLTHNQKENGSMIEYLEELAATTDTEIIYDDNDEYEWEE